MLYADLTAIFLMGLLGSGHCLAMCSGIASTLSLTTPATSAQSQAFTQTATTGDLFTSKNFTFAHQKTRITQFIRPLFLFNLGRILSYAIIGGLMGGFIATLTEFSDISRHFGILRFIAGIMMLLVALHIGQFWNGLTQIENAGRFIWQYLSPIAAKFMPLQQNSHALPLGFIWGWLPCGMVYSALTMAAVSGNSLHSSLSMLAFGIGTLPSMLLVGTLAQQIRTKLNKLIVRRFFALIICTYATFSIYTACQFI